MNERIKELAKAAEYWANTFEDKSRYQEYLMETFAKLIVGECVDKTFDSEKGIGPTRWKTEVMAELKEHFGVEE
jgi:hypothetical protein